jgi:hypothetical protein
MMVVSVSPEQARAANQSGGSLFIVTGTDERGALVTFAGDHRPMSHFLGTVIATGDTLDCEVEPWMVIDVETVETEEEMDGKTWTTDELQQDFEVIGFAAPVVVVRRKSDGQVGTLEFRHHPRVYFDFQPKQED